MRIPGRTALRTSAGFLASACLISQTLLAYEVPLESRSVREGYFLGQRNDEKRAKFLESYRKHLPLPEKGPYISEIELLTPYAQVVDVSRQRTMGYSAQQAEEDYKKRGDTILVHVRIEFTPSYGAIESPPPTRDSRAGPGLPIRRDDFWKDFQIRLSQGGRTIESIYTYGEPVFIRSSGAGWGGLAGAQVWVEYEARDVGSSETVVEVVTPDGVKIAAKFGLDKLR
jgi:hypothetical protein